jgi:hypothetical protein
MSRRSLFELWMRIQLTAGDVTTGFSALQRWAGSPSFCKRNKADRRAVQALRAEIRVQAPMTMKPAPATMDSSRVST